MVLLSAVNYTLPKGGIINTPISDQFKRKGESGAKIHPVPISGHQMI